MVETLCKRKSKAGAGFLSSQTLAGYAPRFQNTGEGLGFANEGSTRREEIQPEVMLCHLPEAGAQDSPSPPAGPQ